MAAKLERRAGDENNIPHELCREILNKLPAKSILRFRSVCKSWYSLISCPDFIADYSTPNPNKNGNRLLLHVWDSFSDFMSCSCHDESCDAPCDHDGMSFISHDESFMESCEHMSHYKKYASPPNVCEIFDLRTGVWRTISPPIPSWNFGGDLRPECYLHGAVHWTGHSPGRKSYSRILLSFNMSDELFREIKLPDCVGFMDDYHHNLETNNWIDIQFVTFSGLIHFIALKCGDDDNVPYKQSDYSIWAMKEYGVVESWTKLLNIELESARLHPRTKVRDRVWLWRNGEILLVVQGLGHGKPEDEIGEFLLYDTGSRRWKRVLSIPKQIVNVCLLEESLALM